MTKETTYQRLKRENQELRQQLREVCINPNSLESIDIRAVQKRFQRVEDAFSVGNIITPRFEHPGFINFIIKGGK